MHENGTQRFSVKPVILAALIFCV